jgi:4-methyl-5(b-hydroxyethyl)-thiazole monophosphate biosynthesis
MSSVAVLFATGFEEIEATTIVDILRRAGILVKMIGIDDDIVTGAHGIQIHTDSTIESLDPATIDGIILPGGSPGYINLRNNEKTLNMTKTIFNQGKLVAAICASPSLLADAEVIQGKRCTIYPGMEEELMKNGGRPVKELVVTDGNVITSKGPATSILFALELVKYLIGEQKAMEVSQETLATEVFGRK